MTDTTESFHTPPPTLSEQLLVLRLRKWWTIGVAILVVAAALGLTFLQDPVYASEAHVLVRPIPLTTAGGVEDPNMTTEEQLARSTAVATIAAGTLGDARDPLTLVETLDVDVLDDTEILRFRATAADPAVARDRAQAFADAYLQFRRQQAQEESTAAAEAIREEITLQQRQLRSVNRRLAETDDPVQRTSLEAQQISLATEIGSLHNQLAGLQASDDARVGQIIRPAEVTDDPVSPQRLRTGALALIVGVLLGIGAALLAERLDDRLRRPDGVDVIARAPTLSIVPRVPSAINGDGPIALRHPNGPYAEAFRTMRTGLMFAAGAKGARTIVVTSSHPGEGKTFTTANLGVALAQAGKRVVVVSGDLRRPELHRVFGVPQSPGLAELIIERGDVWNSLRRPAGLDNLWVLPSGTMHGSAADLLSSHAAQEVLGQLRGSADYVLIDTGPLSAVADSIVLAPATDGVILVVSADKTTRSALRHTRRQLDLVNADVLGTVLNNVRPGRNADAYSAYSVYETVATGRADDQPS